MADAAQAQERIVAVAAAAEAQPTFVATVEAFVREAKQLAAGGLTLAEVGQLFTSFVHVAVAAAGALANPGTEKKALVMAAVATLFDTVGPVIPLPWFLAPARPVLRPILRAIVLAVADGAVEAVSAPPIVPVQMVDPIEESLRALAIVRERLTKAGLAEEQLAEKLADLDSLPPILRGKAVAVP